MHNPSPPGRFGLVVAGLQPAFRLRDEHCRIAFEAPAKVEVPVETSVSGQTGKKHPAVWIVSHPKSRIVGIAPGHHGAAHGEPDFRKLLANAVKRAGGK